MADWSDTVATEQVRFYGANFTWPEWVSDGFVDGVTYSFVEDGATEGTVDDDD